VPTPRHPSERTGTPHLGRSVALPALLAMIPAVTLSAFWLGGEGALAGLAVGLPVGLLMSRIMGSWRNDPTLPRDSVTGLMLRDGFDVVLEDVFDRCADGTLKSACILVQIDDAEEFLARHGQAAMDDLLQVTSDRILGTLRDGESVARLADSRFAICLQSVRQLDLELCIQLAGRLQGVIEEPLRVGGATLYVSCAIGFCLRSRAPSGDAQDWLCAAITALDEARQNGPSSIRAFAPEMQTRREIRRTLQQTVVSALDNGEIGPWFQPQLCTDTGQVSGFEALARWVHDTRGTIAPDQFLPALEEQGLMERLSEVILTQSLSALRGWDDAGLAVPRVSVNLSQDDLNNPRLCDKISWALDRFDLGPNRLCLEILETVMSDVPNDTVARNITGLNQLGCAIDLDDYGTGHASIASLRRFPVHRIKIDRSFVVKSDRDPEQQRLIGALLTMAERLDLETLAEGVETVGEHAFLAQLGCHHVQGFGIGRPMPFDETLMWLSKHEAKLQSAPRIGRQIG